MDWSCQGRENLDRINEHTGLDETHSETVSLAPSPTSSRTQRESTRFSWLVLGFVALVYLATCFAPVIFDDNEGLYAGAVREMHERGDWLMPTTDGFPRVQKPPLVYWMMLVSTSLLGGSEFALRLPNALATAGWIVATYLIMRRLAGERFGLASALVLASMMGVWIFNHLVQPEPFLACFISLSIWCLVEARHEANPRPQWYTLFWIFLALGAMSKGLHGALWPLGTVMLTAVFAPRWRQWLRPVLSARGFGLFLLIVLPWYVYMTVKLPGFLSAHFVNEQIGAALNQRYPADAKQLSVLQFYAQHLIFWMPWTLLFPASIFIAVKTLRRAQIHPQLLSVEAWDIVRLLGCWFALTFVSVAFSTRQDYYSMTCWGIVAAFLAMPWTLRKSSTVDLPRVFLFVPALLVALGGLIALGIVAWVTPQLGSLGAVTAAPIRDRDTFMDAIAGISPALWGHFLILLGIFGAAMLVAGAAGSALAWQRRNFPALLVLSGAMVIPICLATTGFTMMSSYFSLATEARAINRELVAKPDAMVVCEGLPHTASSLYYYLNARVHWVNAPFDQDYAQRVLGEGRDYFLEDAALKSAWLSARPVYLIIDQDRLGYWQSVLPPGARVVNESGTRLVLCNR
jgi:4-amino-4-deoxy-L-arabinose transferase-like glycosyltransferase